MFRRAITLVLRKPIAWKLHVVLYHHPVAGDLGNDRSSGNTEALAVTADYSCLWQFQFSNETAVDQNMIRRSQQRQYRPPARGHRCPKDVEFVDLAVAGNAHADGQSS